MPVFMKQTSKIIRIQQYSVYGMYKMRDIYLNISLVRIGSGSG